MFNLLPMHQVITDRMTLGHIPPYIRLGVVLEKKVPNAILVNQTIRVIHPVLLG